VFIGPNTSLLNDKHPIGKKIPCKVWHKAMIGGGVTILPNVVVGIGATIGAGSVVTKDVLAYTTVKGNPAK